jgi:putative ABC transport system permease protein
MAPWLDSLRQDLRFAVRSLGRTPLFTSVAALSLALGIGATLAVFTLANVMLLKPLPFDAPEQLLVAFQTRPGAVAGHSDTLRWPFAKYERLRRLVPEIEDAGFSTWQDVTIPTAVGAERVRAEIVTASMLTMLRVKPAFGRTFLGDEDMPNAASSVGMVSFRLWRRQFASDPGMVGSKIQINGVPITIVGVMPLEFTGFVSGADVWLPLHVMARVQPGSRWSGRLAEQVGTIVVRARSAGEADLSALRLRLRAAARELSSMVPDPGSAGGELSADVISLAKARRHPMVEPLLILLAIGVGAVLLIVCANVAGLLLARGRARQGEMAVRIALGARPSRIVRQLMTENVVLAFLGTLPGILVAYWGAVALAQLRPQLPQTFVLLRGTDLLAGASLAPDWRFYAAASALALVVALLFGAAPALAAARTAIGEMLKSAGRHKGHWKAGGRRAIVAGQVALATMLLVGAGLMVRSLRAIARTDLGFDPRGVIVVGVSSSDTTAAGRARRQAVLDEIGTLPTVEVAGVASCRPFDRECSFSMPVAGVGAIALDPARAPELDVHLVSPGYFDAMRIPVVAGRELGMAEMTGESRGVLISESAARLLWKDRQWVPGRTVMARGPGQEPSEVIGVVADVKFASVEKTPRAALYMTQALAGEGAQYTATVYVRARAISGALLSLIQQAIQRGDPTAAISSMTSATDLVRGATSSTRFVATLLVVFAAIAAFLAMLGIYGVLAFMVAERGREISIRIAFGAQPRWLVGDVLRQSALLTGAGLGVGIIGALGASSVLSSFLYGVARADALTYVTIVVVVTGVGLLAAFVPAKRVTTVNVAALLRE